MPNIEIKARFEDHDHARKVAMDLGGEHVGTDRQIDTYFCTSQGRLKLRESSLSGAQLIPYLRSDQAGPKKSEYLVMSVEDAAACKALLSEILGVDAIVDKMRDIYLIGNVRLHLDQVKGLGAFLEFEAVYRDTSGEADEFKKVDALIKKFSIREEDLLRDSYREIVKWKGG